MVHLQGKEWITLKFRTAWGTSPAVQWLRIHTSTAGYVSSSPGQGTKISVQCDQNKTKQKTACSYVATQNVLQENL